MRAAYGRVFIGIYVYENADDIVTCRTRIGFFGRTAQNARNYIILGFSCPILIKRRRRA